MVWGLEGVWLSEGEPGGRQNQGSCGCWVGGGAVERLWVSWIHTLLWIGFVTWGLAIGDFVR